MLARVHTPSSPVRGRERKREGDREKEREYLLLKGMTGALAPFSFLVRKSCPE
jgi:hypothetical protein